MTDKPNPFSYRDIFSEKNDEKMREIIEKYGFETLDIDYYSFYFLFNSFWINLSYEKIDYLFEQDIAIYKIKEDKDNSNCFRVNLNIDLYYYFLDFFQADSYETIKKTLYIVRKMILKDKPHKKLLTLPFIEEETSFKEGKFVQKNIFYDNFKDIAIKKNYHCSHIQLIRNETIKIRTLSQIVLKELTKINPFYY